jgi:hypothetical protein
MADNFVTEKLAFAVYQKRIKLGCHLSADEDWKEALDAIKYFEDREAPHDFWWEQERKKVEWLYPLYLSLTEGYEKDKADFKEKERAEE